MAYSLTPFCVVWKDGFANETGFRIVVTYLRSGEKFTHDVGPNATEFVFPPDEAPMLERPEFCAKRGTMQLEVKAVLTNGDAVVDGISTNWECRPG